MSRLPWRRTIFVAARLLVGETFPAGEDFAMSKQQRRASAKRELMENEDELDLILFESSVACYSSCVDGG